MNFPTDTSKLAEAAAGKAHSDPTFTWPVRVYWEDTDAGGVVYHASYLRFLERARTEWLRAHRIDQSTVREDHGVVFVVRDITIEFHAPAKLDDELDVTIDTVDLRSASMSFAQRILRRGDSTVLTSARVRAACVAAADFRPQRIPEALFKDKKR